MATTTATERAYVCISHGPFMMLPGRERAGAIFLDAVEDTKQFIAEFDPDLVVMFGPDHMHLLTELRPPFTGILSGSTVDEFSIPETHLNVAPEAAELFARLVEMDVDLAVGENVKVDHGLSLTFRQLFDDPESVPLIPIVINAIGYPLFPMRRARRVGEIVGQAMADYDGKLLYIGTGGLSHNPPFPEPAPGAKRFNDEQRKESLAKSLEYLDPEWDRSILAKMAAGDVDTFSRLEQSELDIRGGGTNEIRSWAAAWAAAGATPASYTNYELVELWITGMGVAFGLGS